MHEIGLSPYESVRSVESDLSGVQLVSFDIWQTLLKSNPEYKNVRLEAIARNIGYSGSTDSLNDVYQAVEVRLDTESDRTGMQYGFEDRVKAIVEALPSLPTLTSDNLIQLESELVQIVKMYPPLLLEDDIPQTLDALKKKGLQLAVISNTGFIDGRYMRIALGSLGILPYLDYTLFSNEVGVAKPDPGIFEALVEQSGIQPSSIIHIGDNKTADYTGALKAGFKVRHLSKVNDTTTEKISSIRDMLDLLS